MPYQIVKELFNSEARYNRQSFDTFVLLGLVRIELIDGYEYQPYNIMCKVGDDEAGLKFPLNRLESVYETIVAHEKGLKPKGFYNGNKYFMTRDRLELHYKVKTELSKGFIDFFKDQIKEIKAFDKGHGMARVHTAFERYKRQWVINEAEYTPKKDINKRFIISATFELACLHMIQRGIAAPTTKGLRILLEEYNNIYNNQK